MGSKKPNEIDIENLKEMQMKMAETVAKVVGYQGRIEFDTSKPDGAPRKLLNVSRLNSLGWQASITLEYGLRSTYDWFLLNQKNFRT